LAQSNEDIAKMLDNYDKESKALTKSILKLCLHMHGGITLNEAWAMSFSDRNILIELINEQQEASMKS